MKFNLINNSLDSLSEATEYYLNGKRYNDSRLFKYTVLFLSHCIELLLKEILRREHFSLIFEDIDKISASTNYDMTINFSKSLDRIINICGIKFGIYRQYIVELACLRNKIQHFEFVLEENSIEPILDRGFHIVKFLFIEILGESFEDFSEVIDSDSLEKLNDIESLVKEKKILANKSIKEKQLRHVEFLYFNDKGIQLCCPTCSQKCLAYESDGTLKCHFCFKRFNDLEDLYESDENSIIYELLAREIGRRKNKYDLSMVNCPNCNSKSLLRISHDDQDGQYFDWECICCHEKYDDKYCEDCGEHFPDSSVFFATASRVNMEGFDYFEVCTDCANRNNGYYDEVL